MDCSKEALLDELSDFERQKPVEIPAALEEYLRQVAKTGDTLFPWHRMKPLLCRKLEVVMNEFYETFPTDTLPILPNVEAFNYDDMKSKILETLDTFTSAPFTIQRLCELVVDPRKHYKRTDKFMRGVEKNVLVVSTVEPKAASPLPLQQQCSVPMVNGVPGVEDGGINGHTPSEPDCKREHDDKIEERRIPAVMDAVDSVPTLEESHSCNGAADTTTESTDSNVGKESATTVSESPSAATETTISEVEAKEHDAEQLSETSAENVIEECSEEVAADRADAEVEEGSATSGVSTADSAQHSEALSSTEPDVEVSSESTEATLVEDGAENRGEKIEEVTSVEASSESHKELHEENIQEPPHKKFHSAEQESASETVSSTASGVDDGLVSPDTAPVVVALEEPTPMVENGEGCTAVTESMEMNEGPGDTSNTDMSDITETDPLPSLVENKEEPMDQD